MSVPAVDLSGRTPVVRLRTSPAWLPERFRHRPSRIMASFRPLPGERRLFRKRRRGLPSEWAPKHRKVTYGPLKGSYYDPDFVPHMNGIIDTLTFPSVQELTNCKAPQTGGSAGWETVIGYLADNDPADTLIVYPSQDTARKRCVDYLQPMFTGSPRLKRLLTGVADDLASLRVRLQTMLIYMAWAGSVTTIGNVSCRYLLVDELDKCPDQPSKREAGFEDLVSERTTAYDRFGSKKIWNSTPTATPSKIVKKLNEAEVVFDYFTTCPDCGHEQLMDFDRIDFNGERDPDRMLERRCASYICLQCGSAWDDRKRDLAARGTNGVWRARGDGRERTVYLREERPRKVAFHSPAWISPLVSLSKCAAAFLRGLKDPLALHYFVTQIKAEEYVQYDKQRQEDRILALRDDRPEGLVPSGNVVAALVAGVDTQDDGFVYWIHAMGWGLEQEGWLIRAGFVETAAALGQVLFATDYRDVDGIAYPVQLAVQDAMGHRTGEVYDFSRLHPGRIIPYKGAAGRRSTPWTKSKIDRYPGTDKPIPGGVMLYTCDTHHYKDLLAAKLAISADDPGAWHLHKDVTDELARHLCVEYKDERGLWQQPRNRPQHYWDAAMMAIVAADLLQLKFRQQTAAAVQAVERKKTVNPFTGGRQLFGGVRG